MPNKNVTDYYQNLSTEIIQGDLEAKRHEFAVLCENFNSDFNVAAVIRCNNAFLGKDVWVCGRRRFDTRGAVGTNHYEHIKYSPTVAPILEEYRNSGYKIVAVDNVAGSTDMRTYEWLPKTLMLFGQEIVGITNESRMLSDITISIPQFGSVRSLNVGVAAGIAMYDYVKKLNLK